MRSNLFLICTRMIKGVHKKTNISAYFPQSVAVIRGTEFRKKQSFKNWKNRGPPTSLRPVGLGPLFFQFLKDCFSQNSDRIETARLVFFRKWLFGGTVPPGKKLFGGTVPPWKILFGGTCDFFMKLFEFILSVGDALDADYIHLNPNNSSGTWLSLLEPN